MSLEGRYKKAKSSIKKRDAQLAARGTTAGKEVANSNANKSQFNPAPFGASDATPNRKTKMTTPRSEYQDSQEGNPKPPSGDMLF